MPYIITTKRLERIRIDMPRNIEVVDSRHAVATLEERVVFDPVEWGGKDAGDNSQFWHHALVLNRYLDRDHRDELADVLFLHDGRISRGHFVNGMGCPLPDDRLIPEYGGTITLPDGIVIEVKPATIHELHTNVVDRQPKDKDWTAAEIIAAYNEAQR